MTNQQIADAFRAIADRLQLAGANPYRVRAYRIAATNLERSSDSAADLAGRGQLKKIPGIGSDLERKILEGLKTGAIREPEVNGPASETIPFECPASIPNWPCCSTNDFGSKTSRILNNSPDPVFFERFRNWGPNWSTGSWRDWRT